jgi:hypothetical protein
MVYELELMDLRKGGKTIKVDPAQVRLGRMRRRISAWSEVVDEIKKKRAIRMVMATLTYAPEHEWDINHIRDFLKAIRRSLKGGILAYAWVAEMQQRGVPHYHVYFILKAHVMLPTPDTDGFWKWGMSSVDVGRSPFYLVTYLGKEYQKKDYEKGMRVFAVWVKKGLVRDWIATKFRWSALPGWLREEMEAKSIVFINVFPKPNDGGGWIVWVSKARQESLGWSFDHMIYISPWVVLD